MKTKFQFSRTYFFEEPVSGGERRHWFFNLMERFGEMASFRLNDKDRDVVASALIESDGETETVRFSSYGKEYTLRADLWQPKGYAMTTTGRLRKKDDALRDAHLHTIDNRDEIEHSQLCHCICCMGSFPASEIDCYADEGKTAICPCCDCDAVIGDAAGITMNDELLKALNKKYF